MYTSALVLEIPIVDRSINSRSIVFSFATVLKSASNGRRSASLWLVCHHPPRRLSLLSPTVFLVRRAGKTFLGLLFSEASFHERTSKLLSPSPKRRSPPVKVESHGPANIRQSCWIVYHLIPGLDPSAGARTQSSPLSSIADLVDRPL